MRRGNSIQKMETGDRLTIGVDDSGLRWEGKESSTPIVDRYRQPKWQVADAGNAKEIVSVDDMGRRYRITMGGEGIVHPYRRPLSSTEMATR